MHNISQRELEEGRVQYVMHGKDHEKNRCVFLAAWTVAQGCCEATWACGRDAAAARGPLLRRCALTLVNLWARAHVFHQFHFFRLGETMPHVLLRRVRSGHFYPAGNWVIPSQGRGMVRRRAEACWRMLTDPKSMGITDVSAVFFEYCRDRYSQGEAAVESGVAASAAAEPCDASSDGSSPSVARVFELAGQRRARRAAAAATQTPAAEHDLSEGVRLSAWFA